MQLTSERFEWNREGAMKTIAWRRGRCVAIAAALWLALAGAAWGAGFQTAEYHAAYVGQATAGLTLLENAGMVAHLPSGMVRLPEGQYVLGGATYFVPEFEYKALESDETGTTTTEPILGPHGFGIYNRRDWAVGAGVYFPFNVDAEYKDTWAGRDQFTRERLIVGYTSLAGAYAINDELSVGGAVNFVDAWVQLKRRVIVSPGAEIPVELGGTGDAIAYSASVLYHTDNWSVGLTHNPKYTLQIDGTADFDTSAVPASLAQNFPDGGAKVDLLLPSTTELGISYHDRREDPDYFIELNFLRSGWSNFRELRIDFDQPSLPDSVAERNWNDTLGIKLGGNYVVARQGDVAHRLRAGYYRDQGPAPSETVDPAVPDAEGRNEYAIGYGFANASLTVDVAYFYVDFNESKTSGDNPFPAEYDGKIDIYSLSVGYHW